MLEIFFSLQEDVGVVKLAAPCLSALVDEVGGQVAAVELHAFDDVQFVVSRPLAVFNGDDAFLADLCHRFGDDVADGDDRSWRK